jgi:hypothetical protein
LHGLYPGEEGPGPVSTADARGPQAVAPTAASTTAQENGFLPNETIEKSAATEQIEQWPYGPQAAANVPKASNGAAPASDFDPIPVEEYQAAVASVNGGTTSVPAFHQTPQTPNDGLHAANVSQPTEVVPLTAPLVAQPIPAPPESPAIEPHGVPTVDAPPAQNAPPLTQIEQAESPKSVQEPSGSSQRVGLQEPAEPERSPQGAVSAPQMLATPAPQMSAAPTLLRAVQRPTQVPVVRSPQWVGGRYGQPVWMAVPYATQAIPPR